MDHPGLFETCRIGFSVADRDAAEAEAKMAGLEAALRGRLPSGGGFTYFATADQGASALLQVRAMTRS